MIEQEQLPENPISLDEADGLIRELAATQTDILEFAKRLRGRSGVDQRWLAIGITDVEKGIMSINRAFAEAPLQEARAMLTKLMEE